MENEPLRQQADQISALLAKLMRRLSALAPDDPAASLTLPQNKVCRLLSDGPLPMSAVGKELGISLSAVTQIADRLERAGLVLRTADSSDRRVRVLKLTPRAVKMLRQRHERRVARIVDVIARLPFDEREGIVGALRLLEGATDAQRSGGEEQPAGVTETEAALAGSA